MDTVTLPLCATSFATFDFASSDGKRTYHVTTNGEREKTCTCPGFAFRRECKHVEGVERQACLYDPQVGVGNEPPYIAPVAFTHTDFTGEPCPQCGGPTVATRFRA